MSRVAIVGSCITRDLWPVRGAGLAEVLYISRTSFPSLLAPPLKGFQPAQTAPEPLGQHQYRAVIEDLRKTALSRLVAFQPTHIVFDFIDERFDLLSVGGALVTESWELQASGATAQAPFTGARAIPRLSDACDRLWRSALAELAALIEATPLRRARLVLHSARWAGLIREADGGERPLDYTEIMAGRPASIAEHNLLLARYERWFLEAFPRAIAVEAGEHRIADASHRWGASPFHYVDDYYRAIWRGLEALGVSPVRPELAAPSAPTA